MSNFKNVDALSWNMGEVKVTTRGPRLVQEALATKGFWDDWNRGSGELKEAGIYPRKTENGWIVMRHLPVPDGDQEQSKPAVETAPLTIVWSDEQERIFEWARNGEGHLVVRARAGTGKTTTVKVMFKYCKEQRMIYVVFNKRNQKEAERAITDPRVDVRTLHSLGFMFIRVYWKDAKPDENVEGERIREIEGENYVPSEVFGSLLKLVGFAKNCCVNPTTQDLADIVIDRDLVIDEYEDEKGGGWDAKKMAQVAYDVLEASKERREDNLISFDDMVWLPVVKEWTKPVFDLVVVDECQDMNLLQLEIAAGAVKPGGRMVVVGDDRQAIYGFRGAHSNGLDTMKDKLDADEMGLTVTRRCGKSIVRMAQKYVPDYKAADDAPEGVVSYANYDKALEEIKPGDAFLSRINAPLMSACLALLRKGVPARIEGRDIGKTLSNIVKKLKARSMDEFADKMITWRLKQIKRATRNDPRANVDHINDKYDTLVAVSEGCKSVNEIENRLVTMFQDTDSSLKPAVVFSSVHKAKGLEWHKVYMLDYTFTRKKGVRESSPDEVREEENIKYVAITRAKHELVFVTDRAKRPNDPAGAQEPATPTETPAVKPKRQRKAPKQRKAASASDVLGNAFERKLDHIGAKHGQDGELDGLTTEETE
jgi:superfamily I DNA/RNA helicase